MRSGFAIVLIAVVLFGGGYFYYIAQAVCPVPLSYSVGEIDERFNLSKDEIRVVISEAESMWEDATGRNLFSYEEEGDLVVDFVFDDRQQFINEEGSLKNKLDATENISEAIKTTYAQLVEQYNELRMSYETKVQQYEKKLNVYNAEVEKYNKQGGAPEDVYESLSEQKKALDVQLTSLNVLSGQLDALVKEINNIGEKGNSLVNTYNKGVNIYNQTYGEPHEFTQGDYTDGNIKIYTFEDRQELKLVLVHELGHALTLNHVEGEESIMYYMIGEQRFDEGLSTGDLEEFDRVCGEKSLWEKAKVSLSYLKVRD